MGETDEALHGAGDEERTMVQGGENRGKTDIGKRLTRGGQMWYATLDARENNSREEETTMMDTTSRMTPEERAEVLAVIVTRDEAGRHFTEVWDWDTLNELEKAGLIYIDRPIHEPTGIPYSEEYYSVTVTEAGQELVDAYEDS